VSLPLLKVNMLDCVAMDGIPLYQTAFGDPLKVFAPRLFLRDVPSESACFCDRFSKVLPQGVGM
jgi:hypothetical protein